MSTSTRIKHPECVRRDAEYLAKLGWGGARKISSHLSRRYQTDVPEGTVQDWVRYLRAEIDPLELRDSSSGEP